MATKATIYGLEITSQNGSFPVYYDGMERDEESYISIDPHSGKVIFKEGIADSWLDVSFLPGNPFLPMDGNDRFEIHDMHDCTITIESRDGYGLVPKISIHRDNPYADDTVALIEDGNILLEIGGRWTFLKRSGQVTFVPLEIEEAPINGLGLYLGESLVVNDYGQMGIIKPGETTSFRPAHDFEQHKVSLFMDDNAKIFSETDFERAVPDTKLRLEGYFSSGVKSGLFKRATDMIKELRPSLREHVKGLTMKVDLNGGKAADNFGGHIRMAADNPLSSAFHHETAHIHHGGLKGQMPVNWENVAGHLDGLHMEALGCCFNFGKESFHKFCTNMRGDVLTDKDISYSSERPFKEIHAIALMGMSAELTNIVREHGFNSRDFRSIWEKAAGDIYGKDTDGNKKWATKDKYWMYMTETCPGMDISWGMPRHGAVRPYGAFESDEDVATCYQQFKYDPSFFWPLIDPRSERYDERYVKKLSLLTEYGFIELEEVPEWMMGFLKCIDIK